MIGQENQRQKKEDVLSRLTESIEFKLIDFSTFFFSHSSKAAATDLKLISSTWTPLSLDPTLTSRKTPSYSGPHLR